MRHLLKSFENGLCGEVPSRVAELGPGDSIGVGLAALLSGADYYYGLDALPLANLKRNLGVFEELVTLFAAKAEIPGDREFPGIKPKLASYQYPAEKLAAPDQDRIARIRASLEEPARSGSMIHYMAPWWSPTVIERGAVDMIFSQAVLEHVEDLDTAYSAMHAWLAPGGWLSHQIDFRCHGTARQWNGHWAYGDTFWRVLRGRRAFLINREPHSTHLRLLKREGFEIICDETATGQGIGRQRLAVRYRSLSDADLQTSGAFIQARPSAVYHP
jgi:SAM-dependent methyltransferase